MNKIRVLTIASIFILALLSVSMVCAGENITEELSDTDDEPVGLDENQSVQSASVSGDKFENIQTSVDNAKAGDVIELNGTYSGYNAIIVSKSLTFQASGDPVTLNATSSRIFYIQSGDVTFKNIIFANGWDENGGAVYANGKCVFENCLFKNNKATEFGGAIYAKSSLTLTKTTFENNNATSMGGAVYCEYSIKKDASKSYVGDVEVNGCTFMGNTANSGGAVAVVISSNVEAQSKYGNLKIKNSKFDKNKATEFGGALLFHGDYNSGGKLTLDKSNFTQNVGKDGGAIYLLDCDSTISNSNFIKNTADFAAVYSFNYKLTIKNSNFESNSGKYVSGLVLYATEGTIIDSTFKGNNVVSVSIESDSTLKVTKGTSTKNYKAITTLGNSLSKYVTITVKAVKNSMSATYAEGKTFTFQVIDKTTNKPIPYYLIWASFKDGKNSKDLLKTTNKDGKFTQYVGTRLNAGSYEITYHSDGWGMIDNAKHTLKIKKAKPVVKAPVVKAKYKKYAIFKVSVKDGKKQPIAYIKVKMKVYTGKKSKTYTIKTNCNGNAKLNTKKFSKGTHKVVIKSANKNYSFSLKSKIIIK